MSVVSYKCANCGAPLKFNGSSGKWVCASCDSAFNLSDLEKYYKLKDEAAAGALGMEWKAYGAESGSGDWKEGEADSVSVFVCPSCGAEIISDDNTSATECIYCGNTAIIPKRLEGVFRPDIIIPFKLTKDAAGDAYKSFLKGKWFVPKNFFEENRIEKISGVYVPFWLFNCDTKADISYNAEIITMWRDGDYEVTKTDHYLLNRSGSVNFRRIPADGSSKINDVLMESIEPFDYTGCEDFSPAYLSGFLADKYDVDASKNLGHVNERIKKSVSELFRSTTSGYAGVRINKSDIRISKGDISYALMPVWLLNTKYKDEFFTFAMNGQTGRLVGNLPVDKAKFFGYFLGIGALLSIIGYIASALLIYTGVLTI